MSSSSAPNAEAMWRAVLYVQNHLDEPITLEDVAAVAHYSPYHFHRMFKAFTGESFKAYVRRLRLESSAFALRATDASVTDLAFSSGFFTHESFTRAFRRAFGESPQTYRKTRSVPASASDRYLDRVELVGFSGRTCVFRRCLGAYESAGTPSDPDSPWLALAAQLSSSLEELELYGVSRDDPDITAPEHIRYDACVALPGPDQDRAKGSSTLTLPAGRYIRGTHVGPFDALSGSYHYLIYTWAAMYQQVLDKNVPPFERFLEPGTIQIFIPLGSGSPL